MSTNEHEDLSHAMEVLADRQPPAGRPPTAELLHRGRLRKRRRAAVMTGGVAAVAAIAVAGAFAVGGTGGSPTAGGIGPGAAASGSAAPTTTASPSGEPSEKPSGRPSTKTTDTASPPTPVESGTPNEAVADLLKQRIPAGYHAVSTWVFPPKTGGPWMLGAAHKITNGTRTGDIRIEISQLSDVPRGSTYKPTASCGPVVNCTSTRRPDGSLLLVELPPASAGGEQDWRVLLYGTDGGLVTASSGNVPGPGQGTDILSGPPVLNGEQLTALALDPVWQNFIQHH